MKGLAQLPFRWEFFDLLLFFYFFTLHADQLNMVCGPYTLRWNNLLAGFLLLVLLIRYRKECFLIDKKLLLCLGAILFSMLLSFVFSPFKGRCIFFLGFYGMTLLYYVFLPYLLVIKRDEKKILWLYLTSFLVVGCYAGLQLLLAFLHIKDPFLQQKMATLWRPNALSYEPSFYALYMTPFIVIANGYYLLNKERELKLWHILLVNFLFLLSTSTTTILVYILFIPCFLFLASFKGVRKEYPYLLSRCLKFAVFLGGAVVVCSLLFWQLMSHYFFKFFCFGFMGHHSFFIRWNLILNSIQVFLKQPILGVGMGGVPSYLYKAWTMRDMSFYFYDSIPQNNLLKWFEPSNVFTEILASLGIVGGIAFSTLIFLYLKKARLSFHHFSYQDKLWVLLFLASFLVTIVVLQCNQGVFRTYIWTYFALTYGWMVKKSRYLEGSLQAKSEAMQS